MLQQHFGLYFRIIIIIVLLQLLLSRFPKRCTVRACACGLSSFTHIQQEEEEEKEEQTLEGFIVENGFLQSFEERRKNEINKCSQKRERMDTQILHLCKNGRGIFQQDFCSFLINSGLIGELVSSRSALLY